MRILFVYGNMYSLGGVQTLLVRYARWLDDAGHDVHLLTRAPARPTDVDSSLVERFRRHGQVHIADERYTTALPSLRAADLPTADAIVCSNVETLLLGALLQAELMPDARLIAGVFHHREYCWPARWWHRRWRQRLTARLVSEMPLENIFFSTDGMARKVGACLGRDFSSSPVVPLAIEIPPTPLRQDIVPGPLRVVSVARLVPYYPQHRQMIGVVHQLRAEGLEIEYHAYGAGPLQTELERAAVAQGVEDAAVFHGPIGYERFAEAVGDAFAYVGMGTALIEAAALGVPALVGIDTLQEPSTYGFLSETAGNDIGGLVAGHPEYPIADKLRWLARLDREEYAEVGNACRRRAHEFDIGALGPRFVSVLRSAQPYSFALSPASRAIGRADGRLWRLLLRIGMRDTLTGRYDAAVPDPGPSRASRGV